jgi:hypothetical protein
MYDNIYGIATSVPTLVEPGVKYFLNETLHQCHSFKVKHHNLMMNIGIFIGFIVVLCGFLLYKYKGKLTVAEQKQLDEVKKQYILNKIKNVQISKQRANETLITGLPHWDAEYGNIR